MEPTQRRSLGPQLAALAVLLMATLVLYASQGLTHTLVPLRLGNATHAGLVTAGYFAGFALGAFYGATLIQRVGHIRAFGGLLGTVICTVLMLPLFESFWFWMGLRVIHGACIAASAVVVESWLVTSADAGSRGRVLAVYTLAINLGIGLGPLFLMLYPHTGWEAFSIGALLLALSAVPVLFWRVKAPIVPERPRPGLARLIRISPISLAMGAAAGLSSGSFTALVPVYGLSLGLDSAGVGLMVSVSILLGLGLQWPLGHLSDRRDRRRILMLVGSVCALTALALTLASSLGLVVIYLLLALFQGTLYTLYPMALAHANDHFDPAMDTTDIASGLLLAYGVGAALGPALAAGVALALGPVAGFALAALALALAVIFSAWKAGDLPGIAIARQNIYRILPHSTPELFELEAAIVPDRLYQADSETPPRH